MENFQSLIQLMKLFHVFPSRHEKMLSFKRKFLNFLLVQPLVFIFVPNIMYLCKNIDHLDIENLTDHIYTISLFAMFIVNNSVFLRNQIAYRENVDILDQFIQQSKTRQCNKVQSNKKCFL